MLNNNFSRKCLCLLLALGILSIAGGDVQGATEEKDEGAKEKTYAINEAQLQSHLMSFADRFASILDMAIAKFESFNPQGKSRYEVLELMTFSLHQAFLIAAESEPSVALLDMFSMVTLGRIFFEEEGESRYGNAVVPVIDGYRKAEADIRNVAAIVLTPDQMRNLMTIIQRWRKNNPEVKSFPLTRFSNFAADRRDAALTRADDPEGLFESVESATEAVEEMRLLAERGIYLATRIPLLSGLFGDLWLTRIMNNPELQKALADVSQLSQGTAGLATIAEKLPDQIATEREATIKQLMGEVTAMRKATMADFLTEFQRIEKRLIPEIANAMDRAESEGEELVDHTIRQAIFLIGIWLVGYVIARLLIQFFSVKMKASAK
ncbi:MAG: hypothetical protein OET21_11355 [Desulfobacterales bacterium]|jgi:hypothetical protein|nr:hypothetical protein [Desulfobacterales bacterium]MDH3828008.1 hypothetical protein [Desulfobacterales bacterium]MDH3878475.1 hypothetical protein [Desulfobacterales bacterium]